MIQVDPTVRAIFLRAHLRLFAAGMRNSRMSATRVLALAGELTGRKYKRGQYAVALADLTTLIKGETE